uniref:Uncharacterized protein n=1 Tax=Tetradesmus obliquus TaxID=3088 RepID=A0A383V8Z1_TETOB|eukprot:jgi/Sobl393_1/18534/SZX62038.1
MELCHDIQRILLDVLSPRDVCHLGASCSTLSAISAQRRQAYITSRHRLGLRAQHIRTVLQQRRQFLQEEIKLVELLDTATAQEQILEQLQRSPDGIRDLAAAVQAALASVTHQSSTPPHVLKAVQEDCVRLANFVCLFAWKLHLRNRRAALQRQPAQQQPAAADFNAWDVDEDDAAEAGVQVVLLEPQPAVQQPQQQQQQQQQQQLELGAAAAPQAAADPAVQQQQQQQQPAADVHPHPAPQQQQQQQQQVVQVTSVSSQTELGPSLAEVRELVSGLRSLMAPANTSLKPCRASLNLLLHHINLQLAAWNLPAAGAAVGAAAATAAGVGAAVDGAAGEQAGDDV